MCKMLIMTTQTIVPMTVSSALDEDFLSRNAYRITRTVTRNGVTRAVVQTSLGVMVYMDQDTFLNTGEIARELPDSFRGASDDAIADFMFPN